MARRKKNAVDDLLELVSMLPWWVGVALAVVSYFVLHRMSAPVAITTIQPSQLGEAMVQSMWSALAGVGQYVVPLVCLGGSGVSAWKRRERQSLVSNVAQAKGADALDGMSWREFESLVGEAFRLQGFGVVETGGGGADGGVDLVLSKGNEKFLVQCKQWKAYKVGVDVARELYGVMAAKGATGGFVVTSGSFTPDAKAFADGRNVKLLDGQCLFRMIQAGQGVAVQSAVRSATAGEHPGKPIGTKCVNRPGLPGVRRRHAEANRKEGSQCGRSVLGLFKVPWLQGHACDLTDD